MNRRELLKGMLYGAAGLALGRKIFLPPSGGWPTNVYGRHIHYVNFFPDAGPTFCSLQDVEWAPVGGPDLITQPHLDALYAYATGPHEGPLVLDIYV